MDKEFTDAIAGDWGGKPFVDLVHGWKHALQIYPEVRSMGDENESEMLMVVFRSMLIGPLLLVQVGVDMPSST